MLYQLLSNRMPFWGTAEQGAHATAPPPLQDVWESILLSEADLEDHTHWSGVGERPCPSCVLTLDVSLNHTHTHTHVPQLNRAQRTHTRTHTHSTGTAHANRPTRTGPV